MTMKAIDSTRKAPSESSLKSLLLVESDEQKESLRHPIRKRILRTLSLGVADFETEITKKEETLNDGTGLTHSVEVRRPIKRYWMDVPEIIEQFEKRYPEREITSFQCYYHLQKLEEQGLVKQDPPTEYDKNGKKKRCRGLQFKSAARFFIQNRPSFTNDNSTTCIKFMQDLWGLNISVEDCEKLIQLNTEQDEILFNAFEYLASRIEGSFDSMSVPLMLDRLAHVYLSDNDRFIERYRDAKRILVLSGGNYLDSGVKTPTHVERDETRGNNNE